MKLMQVGQPCENCADDHDGKSGSSKLAMGLKLAATGVAVGAELVEVGAEIVETLGQLFVHDIYSNSTSTTQYKVEAVQHYTIMIFP